MDDLIGRTLGHYRVVERVGAGGMGVVYRARDERLDRDVAIKVLPEAAAQDEERLARFEREAKAVGSLNHPNILTIHEIDTYEGQPFIVTELLEGETLREIVGRGAISTRRAVEYARDIAKGLAAAHDKKITHRDLKPDNIFLTQDGHIKILDFGLAKLLQLDAKPGEAGEVPTETLHTGPGIVMGTLGYMSPEQLQGRVVDHRSDVFSFGVVLYELLAGRRPFQGDSKAQIAASILRDEPQVLSDSVHVVSPTLARIVLQCLEKRPENRFESARDLAHMLRAVSDNGEVSTAPPARLKKRPWLRSAATAVAIAIAAVVGWELVDLRPAPGLPDVMRIAVLPFEAAGDDPGRQFLAAETAKNLANDQHLQFFANGLSMSVFDGLALVEDGAPGRLWVIAGESESARASTNLTELRRMTNVNLAIAGVLDVDGDQIKLRLSVLDAHTGGELRSKTIETLVGNLTTFQHEPAAGVAEMLGFAIGPNLIERLHRGNTNVNPAYLSYLKGRGALTAPIRKEKTDRAIAMLQESIEADPMYTPARVALAKAWLRDFKDDKDPTSLEEGLRHAQAAAGFATPTPETYLVLASLYDAAGRDDEMLRALENAVSSAPNRAVAYIELGDSLGRRERYEEAEAAFERAINLRPSWQYGHHKLAVLYLEEGEYDAAANRFRRMTELAPGNPAGFNNLGSLYYFLGRRDDAEEMFLRSVEVGANADNCSNLGTMAFEDARYGDAAEHFENALAFGTEDYGIWGNLASAYYWSGERERAESAYRRALQLGKARLDPQPTNPNLLAVLAGFSGMLGDHERGMELIEAAIALDPENEESMATVAESLEDLGERERAIEWIARAFEAGLNPAWIDRRPGLRELASTSGYRALLEKHETE